MGGATSPSTSLVSLPAPGMQNPGIAANYNQMVQGYNPGTGGPQGVGPTSLNTLSSMATTGNPTDVGPAYQAMVSANQRQVKAGESNLLESFGQMGLRNSSSAMTADVDYQSNVATQFANILSQYTMQSQESASQRQLQAAGLGSSLYTGLGTQSYPTAALATGPSALSTAGSVAQGGLETLALLGLL